MDSDEAVPAADESEIVSVEEFAAPFELARTEGNKSEGLWKINQKTFKPIECVKSCSNAMMD